MALSKNPITADLTPAEMNLLLYEGTSNVLTVYRRDPVTKVALTMSGFSNPVAVWKETKGATASTALGAVLVGDTVEVSITAAVRDTFTVKGFWRVEVDDAAGNTLTLVRGAVTLEEDI